jgi:hypothetical protein
MTEHLLRPTLLLLDAGRNLDHDWHGLGVQFSQRVLDGPVFDLAVPLILDLRDPHVAVTTRRVDQDLRVDCLLGADTLHPVDIVSAANLHTPQECRTDIWGHDLLIPRLQSQLNRIATALDLTSQPLDLAEGGLQAVPLRLELLPAGSIGQGVVEGGGVGPQRELALGGVTGEEI